MNQTLKKLSLLLFMASALTPCVWSGDVDVKLTTNDGSTIFTIQDSASVVVSTIDSNGNASFNSITQTGSGGNLLLNTNSLQSGATFYVSSGTVNSQLIVGNTLHVGSSGANTDNYTAYPLSSAAALSTKQVVVLTPSGINTTATASSATVVGVTVSATSGAGELVWVAMEGIVTGVTCNATLGVGTRVCTAASAGRIGTCSSATAAAISIGKMLTSCTGGGTGTVLLKLE